MKTLHVTYLGQPKEITTKFGIKQKNSIKAVEEGDKYLSFWVSPATRDWKVGDEISVESVTSREYNGKTYWDIVMPKANGGNNQEVMSALGELNNRTVKILLGLEELILEKRKGEKSDYPVFQGQPNFEDGVNISDSEDIDGSQIPF